MTSLPVSTNCLKNDILNMMLDPKGAPEVASSPSWQIAQPTNTMYLMIAKIMAM